LLPHFDNSNLAYGDAAVKNVVMSPEFAAQSLLRFGFFKEGRVELGGERDFQELVHQQSLPALGRGT
jgi:hypothetical protein